MKRILIFLILLLVAGARGASAGPRPGKLLRADTVAQKPHYEGAHMRFEETSHNFGHIARRGGDLVCEFRFTNDGTQPLVILRAISSCSCAKAVYPRKPVAPGASGTIRVIYEPHKKEPGTFSKVLQIYSNSVDRRNVLTIKGYSIDVKKL